MNEYPQLLVHRIQSRSDQYTCPAQVYDLEKEGGSIMGGVIKQMQSNKANPPPERDSRLPPKPAGQTVASFKNGLITLPKAIAARLDDKIRYAPSERHTHMWIRRTCEWNMQGYVSSGTNSNSISYRPIA